ncbi:MAG: hypothetical protein WC101_00485 [Candidatus Gracilibacteria bacterium]
MTRVEQKDDELRVAGFFIQRLNEFYKFDYQGSSNADESGDDVYVDIFARSDSGKHEELRLQLTISDGEFHHVFAEISKERRKKNLPYVFGRTIGGHILDPIKAVLEKKGQKTSGEEILIIYNDYTAGIQPFDANYAKTELPQLAQEVKFKGVYLVILPPSFLPGTSTVNHEGQIVALKNAFGENGEVF